MEQKLQRYGPLGAILGIILVLVSFVVHGKWASTEESAQEIADLYVQNQDRVFMGSPDNSCSACWSPAQLSSLLLV